MEIYDPKDLFIANGEKPKQIEVGTAVPKLKIGETNFKAASVGNSVDPKDVFLSDAADSETMGAFKAAARAAPTGLAGLAGAAAGSELGAIAGAFTGPAAPVAVPTLAFLGGIGGAFGASALTGKAIDWTIPRSQQELVTAQTSPKAVGAGGFGGGMIGFTPNTGGIAGMLSGKSSAFKEAAKNAANMYGFGSGTRFLEATSRSPEEGGVSGVGNILEASFFPKEDRTAGLHDLAMGAFVKSNPIGHAAEGFGSGAIRKPIQWATAPKVSTEATSQTTNPSVGSTTQANLIAEARAAQEAAVVDPNAPIPIGPDGIPVASPGEIAAQDRRTADEVRSGKLNMSAGESAITASMKKNGVFPGVDTGWTPVAKPSVEPGTAPAVSVGADGAGTITHVPQHIQTHEGLSVDQLRTAHSAMDANQAANSIIGLNAEAHRRMGIVKPEDAPFIEKVMQHTKNGLIDLAAKDQRLALATAEGLSKMLSKQIAKSGEHGSPYGENHIFEMEYRKARIDDIINHIKNGGNDPLPYSLAGATEYVKNMKYYASKEREVEKTRNTPPSPEQADAESKVDIGEVPVQFTVKRWNADPSMPNGGGIVQEAGQSPIVEYSGRLIVLRNINGVQVPFYLSTGDGGKKDVPSGKWYPFFGVAEGWLNKKGGKDMANYHGREDLAAVARQLDRTIGDIRHQAGREKFPQIGNKESFAHINQGLTPTENGTPETRAKLDANIKGLFDRLDAAAAEKANLGNQNPDRTETPIKRNMEPSKRTREEIDNLNKERKKREAEMRARKLPQTVEEARLAAEEDFDAWAGPNTQNALIERAKKEMNTDIAEDLINESMVAKAKKERGLRLNEADGLEHVTDAYFERMGELQEEAANKNTEVSDKPKPKPEAKPTQRPTEYANPELQAEKPDLVESFRQKIKENIELQKSKPQYYKEPSAEIAAGNIASAANFPSFKRDPQAHHEAMVALKKAAGLPEDYQFTSYGRYNSTNDFKARNDVRHWKPSEPIGAEKPSDVKEREKLFRENDNRGNKPKQGAGTEGEPVGRAARQSEQEISNVNDPHVLNPVPGATKEGSLVDKPTKIKFDTKDKDNRPEYGDIVTWHNFGEPQMSDMINGIKATLPDGTEVPFTGQTGGNPGKYEEVAFGIIQIKRGKWQIEWGQAPKNSYSVERIAAGEIGKAGSIVFDPRTGNYYKIRSDINGSKQEQIAKVRHLMPSDVLKPEDMRKMDQEQRKVVKHSERDAEILKRIGEHAKEIEQMDEDGDNEAMDIEKAAAKETASELGTKEAIAEAESILGFKLKIKPAKIDVTATEEAGAVVRQDGRVDADKYHEEQNKLREQRLPEMVDDHPDYEERVDSYRKKAFEAYKSGNDELGDSLRREFNKRKKEFEDEISKKNEEIDNAMKAMIPSDVEVTGLPSEQKIREMGIEDDGVKSILIKKATIHSFQKKADKIRDKKKRDLAKKRIKDEIDSVIELIKGMNNGEPEPEYNDRGQLTNKDQLQEAGVYEDDVSEKKHAILQDYITRIETSYGNINSTFNEGYKFETVLEQNMGNHAGAYNLPGDHGYAVGDFLVHGENIMLVTHTEGDSFKAVDIYSNDPKGTYGDGVFYHKESYSRFKPVDQSDGSILNFFRDYDYQNGSAPDPSEVAKKAGIFKPGKHHVDVKEIMGGHEKWDSRSLVNRRMSLLDKLEMAKDHLKEWGVRFEEQSWNMSLDSVSKKNEIDDIRNKLAEVDAEIKDAKAKGKFVLKDIGPTEEQYSKEWNSRRMPEGIEKKISEIISRAQKLKDKADKTKDAKKKAEIINQADALEESAKKLRVDPKTGKKYHQGHSMDYDVDMSVVGSAEAAKPSVQTAKPQEQPIRQLGEGVGELFSTSDTFNLTGENATEVQAKPTETTAELTTDGTEPAYVAQARTQLAKLEKSGKNPQQQQTLRDTINKYEASAKPEAKPDQPEMPKGDLKGVKGIDRGIAQQQALMDESPNEATRQVRQVTMDRLKFIKDAIKPKAGDNRRILTQRKKLKKLVDENVFRESNSGAMLFSESPKVRDTIEMIKSYEKKGKTSEATAESVLKPFVDNEPASITEARKQLSSIIKNMSRGEKTDQKKFEAECAIEQFELETKLLSGEHKPSPDDLEIISNAALEEFVAKFDSGDIDPEITAIVENELSSRFDAMERDSVNGNEKEPVRGDIMADIKAIVRESNGDIAIPTLPESFDHQGLLGLAQQLGAGNKIGLSRSPKRYGKIDAERAKTDLTYRKNLKDAADGMLSDLAQALAERGWTQVDPTEANTDVLMDLISRAANGETLTPEGGVGGVAAEVTETPGNVKRLYEANKTEQRAGELPVQETKEMSTEPEMQHPSIFESSTNNNDPMVLSKIQEAANSIPRKLTPIEMKRIQDSLNGVNIPLNKSEIELVRKLKNLGSKEAVSDVFRFAEMNGQDKQASYDAIMAWKIKHGKNGDQLTGDTVDSFLKRKLKQHTGEQLERFKSHLRELGLGEHLNEGTVDENNPFSRRDMSPDAAKRELDRRQKRNAENRAGDPEGRKGYAGIIARVTDELRLRGGLTPKQIEGVTRIMKKIGSQFFEDVKMRINKGKEGELGQYDAIKRIVSIFAEAVESGKFEETAAHEIAHHITRFLPEADRLAVIKEMREKRADLLKANKGLETLFDANDQGDWAKLRFTAQQIAAANLQNPTKHLVKLTSEELKKGGYKPGESIYRLILTDETYRLTKPDEYFAEEFKDSVMRELNSDPVYLGRSRNWKEKLSGLWETIKISFRQLFGKDIANRILKNFAKGRYNADLEGGVSVGGRGSDLSSTMSKREGAKQPEFDIKAGSRDVRLQDQLRVSSKDKLTTAEYDRLVNEDMTFQAHEWERIERTVPDVGVTPEAATKARPARDPLGSETIVEYVRKPTRGMNSDAAEVKVQEKLPSPESMTNPEGKVMSMLRDATEEQSDDADAFKAPRPGQSVTRTAWDIASFRYFSGISTKAHQNAERNEYSTVLKRVANIIHARPGTNSNAFERDMPTAIAVARTKFHNKLNKVMEPLRDMLGGFKNTDQGTARQQREEVYQALTDMITGRRGITSGEIGKSAMGLKDLLAEIHEYRRSSGEDIGEIEDYFPAVYDSPRIGENRTEFVKDAKAAYKLELGNLSPEEAARELGMTKKEYETAMEEDPTSIEDALDERAENKAKVLYDNHVRGASSEEFDSIFGGSGMTSGENQAKSRKFGREAQNIMQKWQVKDPFRVVGRYVTSSAKRAELVRRFGNKGEKWKGFSHQMEKDGVPYDTISEMRDLVRKAAGIGIPPRGKAGQTYVDTITLMTAASAMGRGFMNNLIEPITIGMRTGSPIDILRAYGETWTRFLREIPALSSTMKKKMGETFWTEYGNEIGTIHNSIEDAWMSTHSMDLDAEYADPRFRWLTNRIYKANLMDASETAKQQASHTIGFSYINRISSMLRGDHWTSSLGLSAKQSATDQLNELGIPQGRHAEFIDFTKNLENANDSQRMQMMTSGGEMAEFHREAMVRFSMQSSVRTNRAHKPVFQDDNLGKTVLQLMNFSYSYAAEVNTRMYNMTKQAFWMSPDGKDYSKYDRLRMMGPAAGGMLSILAYRGLLELKDLLYPSESSASRAKDPEAVKWANATSYAGLLGPKFEQVVKAVKRDQAPGGPTGQMAVNAGRAAKNMFESLAEGKDMSGAQKSAAKAAIPVVKGAVVTGASAINPILGAAATQITNMPQVMDQMVPSKTKGSLTPDVFRAK